MIPELAERYALEMMEWYGLKGWKFRFMHSHRDFGYCFRADKRIELSIPLTLINEPDLVMDTVLHEIAHALCPVGGHGKEWRAVARKLGAIPEATKKSRHGAKMLFPYAAGCGACGMEYFGTKNYGRRLCGNCLAMDRRSVIEWQENPWKEELQKSLG